MSRFKCYISSDNISYREASPVWAGAFSHKKERDAVFYTQELKDELLFKGDDYAALILLEQSPCEVVDVEIWRQCEGEYSLYWTGDFTWFDVKVNKDYCTVRVTPSPKTGYECLQGEWEIEQNIYSAASTVTVYPFQGELQVACCTATNEGSPPPAPTGGDCTESFTLSEWCGLPISDVITPPDPPFTTYVRTTCYGRVVADGTCSGGTPVAPNTQYFWNLLENNCPTSSKWWRCVSSLEQNLSPMNTGRLFKTVLQWLVDQTNCGLTVKSDFFDINPDGSSPDNLAYTYAENNLKYLTIHQKSDVKRPNASNPALSTVYVIKLKELIDDLRIMFNVYFRVEENETVLRLEHHSYFTQGTGMDLTAKPMKLEYSTDGADLVAEELYKYADEIGSQKITYSCGTGSRDFRLRLISTPVSEIQNQSNQESVSDRGWVLCANRFIGGKYYLIDGNLPLLWGSLHSNLFRHNRAFPSGTLNGQNMQFLSWRKNRKQEPFTIDICCDDVFDPTLLITTPLSEGEVEDAEYNLIKDTLKLTLKY